MLVHVVVNSCLELLFVSLEACMVSYSRIEPTDEVGGYQVSSNCDTLCTMSEEHSAFSHKDLQSTSSGIQGQQQSPECFGSFWESPDSQLVLRFLLDSQ